MIQTNKTKLTVMNFHDVIDFSINNPIANVATVDNGIPRVRVMGLWFADLTGFYFQTSIAKDVSKQLMINPNIEICFYRRERLMCTVLRVSGSVELISDALLITRLFSDRPYLKSCGMNIDSKELIIFRLSHGKAFFWMMSNNINPTEYIDF